MKKLTYEKLAELTLAVDAKAEEIQNTNPEGETVLRVADAIQHAFTTIGVSPSVGKAAMELLLYGTNLYLDAVKEANPEQTDEQR